MTFILSTRFQRPVIQLKDFHGLLAMIDTGAKVPVWMNGESKLRELGAVKKRDKVPLGGIGGTIQGALYEIPVFRLGGLVYPNMGIIAHRSDFPVPVLLPATMFHGLIYEINNKTHRLNITVPDDESISRSLTIRDEDGRLCVFCSSAE